MQVVGHAFLLTLFRAYIDIVPFSLFVHSSKYCRIILGRKKQESVWGIFLSRQHGIASCKYSFNFVNLE